MNKRITFTVVMLLLTASTGLASLTDGLVAYYPFDGDANDLSGNANHAVVYGALPTEDRLAISDLSASASNLSRDSKLDGSFSIYLGVGNVNGRGKVIQLDGAGKRRGMVELPSTPYGLAYDSVQLWAAIPSAKRVVSIDAQGRVNTVLEAEELKNPISVAAAPGNPDILVADNHTDVLVLLSRNHANEYKVIYRGETSSNLQNVSVAMTLDGFGLMGTSNPRGVYHFPLRVGISLGAPILSSGGDVAADPTSTRWAVMQHRSLHVLDGAQEVFQLPLPTGYSSYRGGLLTFATDGTLVVALATDGGVELCVIDISEKTFGSLFRWSGERLVSLAIGQKLDWPIAQQMKPARVELRNDKPVTSGNATIAIPQEKLSLSPDMQGCAENLKKIYAAIKQYEKDKRELPDWLSDLVPDYLSSEMLLCPNDAGHKSPYSPDPKLPCSYGWEFSAEPIPPGWDPTGRTLYRDWKGEQIKVFGDIVPMVRCYHHGSERVLNLSAGGEILWGPLDWEFMFRPDYASIHEQTLSRAVASRPAVPAPSGSAPKQSSPLVGKLAPSFTLKDLKGKQISLSDFKGKVVLLDFWATWCGPCRQAIPHLELLHKKYKEQGLVVIGINHEQDHEKVKKYAEEQISYVVLLDADEQFKEYGIRGIPTAFYIDREGKIRYCEIGFSPGREKEVEQKVKELLGIKEDVATAPKSSIEEVSGTKLLKGTWAWDIDSNSDGPKISVDIWWEHVNQQERYLVPMNGAGITVVKDRTFEDLNFSDLIKMDFASRRISASDAKPDIDVGTILAVRTNEGNLAKLEVTGFDPLKSSRHENTKYHMRLRYTFYGGSRQSSEGLSDKQVAQADDENGNKERLSVKVPLEHNTEMSRWGISYYQPRGIQLSTNEPPQNWILPQINSATHRRFWARKMFGGNTTMNVVIHAPHDPKAGAWDVFATFDEDVDFSSTIPISIGERSHKEMEFNIAYGNGAKQPYVIRFGPNTLNPGRFSLSYYRGCIRTGTADVLGKEYRIALSDDNGDGLYSDLADTTVLISRDADGHMIYRDRVRADSPIEIGQSDYFTIEISDDGSSALLRPAEYGILEGSVTHESSNTPVPNARVKTTPYGFDALTGADGRYEMRLPAGRYYEVQVTASGYIPQHVKRVPSVLYATAANLSAQLSLPKSPQSGEITLRDGDSFHFLSGQRHKYVDGDFYFRCSDGSPMFLANNRHQGGLVDLGQIQTPLDAVTPPMRGYNQFGVVAEVGHVYVSPAKQGEEGCHIVFRVIEIKQGESCTLKYYYRQGETIR